MAAISNATASDSIFPLKDTHSYLTFTHLNLTDTSNAFNQGKRAFASHNYQQAIQSYTIALNHLYEDLESTILLHRAVAYEKLHNYHQALDDCTKIKNRARGVCPDVYWATANILLGHGKLEQAAAIYKEGFNNMSGDVRKQFERRYHDVVTRQIDHNQWLTRSLPHEILSSILSLLPFSARGQLALTCRFWYKFILKEWSEMWSCIDSVHMMPRHSRAAHQLLDQVQADQVRKVKINLCGLYWGSDKEDNEVTSRRTQIYGMGDLSRLIFKTILNQNWNKIKYLDISPLNNEQLRSILQLNKDTVKYLMLHHQTNNKHCSQEEMLVDATQLCSHLSTIEHNVSGNEIHVKNIKVVLPVPQSGVNLYLTKLILRCKMTLESLVHIFTHALHINSLELQNHELNHARVLEAVYEHCPGLNTFSYLGKVHYCTGSMSATYMHSTTTRSNNTLISTTTSNYRSSSDNSLKVLAISIRMDRSDQELDRVIQLFLQRGRSSLQHLTLEWKPDYTLTSLSSSLSSLLENNSTEFAKHPFYPLQLRKLILGCEAATARSTAATSLTTTTTITSLPLQNCARQWLVRLISSCPNLQEIELKCTYYYFADDKIYSALGKLKQLGRLTLDFCLCNHHHTKITNDSKTQKNQENIAEALMVTNSVSTLFSHHHQYQRRPNSRLRYLKIMHSNRQIYRSLGTKLSVSVVEMISCIRISNVPLCELDISNIEFESADQFVTVFNDLKACHGLSTLKIRWPSRHYIREKELKAMASLQDLEDLEIFAWYTVFNKPALIYLFESRQEGGPQLFIIRISMNDGQYLGGHKRSTSLSSSIIDNSQHEQGKQRHAQCLHKKYSIYDKSVYRKEDKIQDVYCKECNSRHQWRILS